MLINKCTCVSNSLRTHQSEDDQWGPGMSSNAVVSRYLLGLSFPFCKVRAGAGHTGARTQQDCQGKMPASEDAARRPFSSPRARAAPSPSPPSPPHCCWPPPPPRLQRAMGGGQRAESGAAKPSRRCHLIPSRLREASNGYLVRRALAPSDPPRISGEGLGGSGDHPPPRSEAESSRVSTAVVNLGLGGGVGWTGPRWRRWVVGSVSSGPSAWRA